SSPPPSVPFPQNAFRRPPTARPRCGRFGARRRAAPVPAAARARELAPRKDWAKARPPPPAPGSPPTGRRPRAAQPPRPAECRRTSRFPARPRPPGPPPARPSAGWAPKRSRMPRSFEAPQNPLQKRSSCKLARDRRSSPAASTARPPAVRRRPRPKLRAGPPPWAPRPRREAIRKPPAARLPALPGRPGPRSAPPPPPAAWPARFDSPRLLAGPRSNPNTKRSCTSRPGLSPASSAAPPARSPPGAAPRAPGRSKSPAAARVPPPSPSLPVSRPSLLQRQPERKLPPRAVRVGHPAHGRQLHAGHAPGLPQRLQQPRQLARVAREAVGEHVLTRRDVQILKPGVFRHRCGDVRQKRQRGLVFRRVDGAVHRRDLLLQLVVGPPQRRQLGLAHAQRVHPGPQQPGLLPGFPQQAEVEQSAQNHEPRQRPRADGGEAQRVGAGLAAAP